MGRDIRTMNWDNEWLRADDDWVEKHQRRLRDAHRMARVHLQQHADDRKQRYDRRAGDLPLAVGDRVYLRNRQMRGRNKIQDVWDSAVYKVVCRQGVNHLYTVEREDGLGTLKTINRADIRVCTQDPETPGIERRRRLPCTPGSSTDVTDSDSSVGTSDRPLLYVVNRSHDERPSSTDTLPETAREETVNRSHDERSSSADTLPETAHEETDDNEPDNELDEPIRRRSTRLGAGRHSNPYGLPRSAWAQWTVTTKTVNELSTRGAGRQTTPYVLSLFGVDAMIRGLRTIGWNDVLHWSWTLHACNGNLQNYVTNFNIQLLHCYLDRHLKKNIFFYIYVNQKSGVNVTWCKFWVGPYSLVWPNKTGLSLTRRWDDPWSRDRCIRTSITGRV